MTARAALGLVVLVLLAGCLHVSLASSVPVLSVSIETPPARHSDGGADP